jgi:signal transduction histidine kinase
MLDSSRPPGKRRTVWWALLIGLSLVVAQIEVARDLYCDTVMIRAVALRSEMSQLRSQTVRRASRLETLLDLSVPVNHSSAEINWQEIASEPWLTAQWSSLSAPLGKEYYVAVVDPVGLIILHTNPAAVGKRLTSEWDDNKVPDAGGDVVRLAAGPLAGERTALDVNVPLVAFGSRLGRMHSGLDADAFDRQVAAEQRQYLWKRSWIVGLILAANLAAIFGLVVLTRDFGGLRRKVARVVHDQKQLLAKIGVGLAHELRNPLHALRINVHTLKRSLGRASLSEQQVGEIMQESSDEIDRMDALVRDFVQFTVPQSAGDASADFREQVQATLHLLAEDMRRKHVQLKTELPDEPVNVRMSADRLRHTALNLFTFAQRSAGENGTIEIQMSQSDGAAELIIADSGKPLSHRDQDRLFEPFQATAHSDSDLGLALIHRFIKEAGGTIVRTHSHGRNCFQLQLPLAKNSPQGT